MVATVILSCVIFGFMAFVIGKGIKKAKNGESGCGCGCSGCSSSSSCHSVKIKK